MKPSGSQTQPTIWTKWADEIEEEEEVDDDDNDDDGNVDDEKKPLDTVCGMQKVQKESIKSNRMRGLNRKANVWMRAHAFFEQWP